MYKTVQDVPPSIRRFYREVELTRVINHVGDGGEPLSEVVVDGVEIVLDTPEEVTYEDVSLCVSLRWSQEAILGKLRAAILWEDFDVNHNQKKQWMGDMEEWYHEAPSAPRCDENGMVEYDDMGQPILIKRGAPVAPTVDLEKRRGFYKVVALPNEEPLTRQMGEFSEVFYDDELTVTRVYEIEPFSSEEIRQVNKRIRDEGRMAPITVGEHTFDCDEESLQNMRGAITSWPTLMKDPSLQELGLVHGTKMLWTLEDNTTVLLTKTQLVNVVNQVNIRAGVLHATYLRSKLTRGT